MQRRTFVQVAVVVLGLVTLTVGAVAQQAPARPAQEAAVVPPMRLFVDERLLIDTPPGWESCAVPAALVPMKFP